ncbi:congested-like trachea protein isoform X1 [Rhizophagus clarus]|uniref:Congested-like trachea protein isoform X1 n=1 Tax=Rhizophagus clarus TaxID=94130 RepID=A0A8H3LM59_9GLOM|nr:congested-like trachea protein isoform X1 [Rhizophagus clarus]
MTVKRRELSVLSVEKLLVPGNASSTNVCKNTLRKYLHEQGVCVRKPFVNESNRQKRLTWAKERKEWTSEWENIIWSDESKFELFEDNAPIHTARVVKSWKEENDINSIPRPAQSPDLNPIENLWDELERRVRAHVPLPKSRENLWEILQEEWSNIDINKYQNLVDIMPRRISAIIKSKGHPTKY